VKTIRLEDCDQYGHCVFAARATEQHKRITFHIADCEYYFPHGRQFSFDVHATTFDEYKRTIAQHRREVSDWVLENVDVPVAVSEYIYDIKRNDEQ
jgi:hypothetical protein